MADLKELHGAFLKAAEAGDEDAATFFAAEIKNYKPTVMGEVGKVANQVATGPGQMIGGLADLGAAALAKVGIGKPDQTGYQDGALDRWVEENVPFLRPGRNVDKIERPSQIAAQVPQPETAAGRYAAEGLKGVTGGLLAGGPAIRAVPRIAGAAGFAGGTGGVTGEAAANLFDDSPWARLLGTLTGTLGGGLLYRGGESIASLMGAPSPSTGNLLKDGLRGISDDELTTAQRMMREGDAHGVPLTTAQAMSRPTPLQGLQERIASSEHGEPMVTALYNQGPQATAAGRQVLNTVAPAGRDPTSVAKQGQDAASAHLTGLQAERTAAVRGPYDVVRNLTQAGAEQTYNRLMAAAQQAGPTTELGRELTKMANRFILQPGTSARGTTPPTPTLYESRGRPISELYSEAKALIEKLGAQDAHGRHVAGQLSSRIQPLEEAARRVMNDKRVGDEAFAQLSRDVVNPAQAGLLGKLAAGADEAAQGPVARIKALFDAKQSNPNAIINLERQLRVEDRQAFPALVRQWMQTSLDDATKLKEGASNPSGAAQWASNIAGAPGSPTRDNFRAAWAGVARANGQREQEVVRGAERFFELVQATGRGKAGLGQFRQDPGGTAENIAMEAARYQTTATSPGVLRWLTNLGHEKSFKEVTEVLTSPEGVGYLKELSRLPNHPRIAATMGAALTNIGLNSSKREE